jgi:hypothetical protein
MYTVHEECKLGSHMTQILVVFIKTKRYPKAQFDGY